MSSNFVLSKVCSVQRLPRLWLHLSLSHYYYHWSTYAPSLARLDKACVWGDRAKLENTKLNLFQQRDWWRFSGAGSLENIGSFCFVLHPREQGRNEKNRRHVHGIFQKKFLSKYLGENKQSQFASECTLDFAFIHRGLLPSLILISSMYSISFNNGTATETKPWSSWRNILRANKEREMLLLAQDVSGN